MKMTLIRSKNRKYVIIVLPILQELILALIKKNRTKASVHLYYFTKDFTQSDKLEANEREISRMRVVRKSDEKMNRLERE